MKTDTRLTALSVRVGPDLVHVGKVGLAPISSHPSVAGHITLYKETVWRDLYCRETRSYSIDKAALDYAVAVRACRYVAIYCTDEPTLIVTTADSIQGSPAVDLGQRPQYRFPPSTCNVIRGQYQIAMPWTNRIIIVDDVPGYGVKMIGGIVAESMF